MHVHTRRLSCHASFVRNTSFCEGQHIDKVIITCMMQYSWQHYTTYTLHTSIYIHCPVIYTDLEYIYLCRLLWSYTS